LLLVEVLGWPAAEVADALETSVAAVNSALQRARNALANRNQGAAELSQSQKEMVNRYVAAFESYDIEGLSSLLREDATLCMPPYELWPPGPGVDSHVDAGNGFRVPGITVAAYRGMWFARLRPVSAKS